MTTNDEQIAQKVRMLRDHGQRKKHCHEMEGYNGRLDAIQAGILRIKLRHLPDWNKKRQQISCRYKELLGSLDVLTPPHDPSWASSVQHLYVIRTHLRDDLKKRLSELGIAVGVHYPVPLHLQKAYGHMGYKRGDFPVSEKLALEILSLPMSPELTNEQQDQVVEEIRRFLACSLCFLPSRVG